MWEDFRRSKSLDPASKHQSIVTCGKLAHLCVLPGWCLCAAVHDDKSRQQPPSKQVACTFDVFDLLVGRMVVVCVVNQLGVDLCGGGMVVGCVG